jgi:hypothetical protein
MALNVSKRRENSGRVDGSFDQHFNKIILNNNYLDKNKSILTKETKVFLLL